MPSSSAKQARFMRAVAHGWKPDKGGPTREVAREFVNADKGRYQRGGAVMMRPGMMGKMSPTRMMGRQPPMTGRAGPQRIMGGQQPPMMRGQTQSGPKMAPRQGPGMMGGQQGPLSVVGRGAPPKFAPRMQNPMMRQADTMMRGAPGMTGGALSRYRR